MPEDSTICEMPIALAWTVRGDPAQRAFLDAACTVLRLALPLQPNTSTRGGDTALLWLGPRSWLYVATDHPPGEDFDAARNAINAAGGALFDVSSSYVAWTVSGAEAARTLNAGCPLDLAADVFRPGDCAQSVLGQVNALIHRPDERAAFIVMVARSFAADAASHLGCTSEASGRK